MDTNFLGAKPHCTDDFLNETISVEELFRIRNLYDDALYGNEKSLYELLDIIHKTGFDSGSGVV